MIGDRSASGAIGRLPLGWVAVVTGILVVGLLSLTGCTSCEPDGNEEGWQDLLGGRVEEARDEFSRAAVACPDDLTARTGLGYVALLEDDLDRAEMMFEQVLSRDSAAVRALLGRGMLHRRRGEMAAAGAAFERAVMIDESDEALDYVEQVSIQTGDPTPPPAVRPDTLEVPARVSDAYFEVRTAEGWERFYIKGVNLGVGIPGSHPTEFPDSATYGVWLRLMGAMGANTLRTYTIHPPDLYAALLDYNEAHEEAPIRLFQGAWVELPPDGVDFDDFAWLEGFHREMRRAVDVIHGRTAFPPRPGHAWGNYTADVSPWVVGFILGRQLESEAVAGYNELNPELSEWSGRYVGVEGGTPTDVWLAKAVEGIISYETDTYNTQRPVAYTNWSPTDPLQHTSDANVDEEGAIRRSFGSEEDSVGGLAGADAVSLDPVLMVGSGEFEAGLFASYHVYPYSPDFMVLEPALAETPGPFGPSNYWGYLMMLKEHHGDMPVLVAEYGIPASIGTAHFQPQGWHHGGVDEERMGAVVARMTREIAAAGMAGGLVFSWIDEWFKQSWINEAQEVPQERDRLWYNRMDPEEHYGMLAAEAAAPVEGRTLAERMSSWEDIPPLLQAPDGSVLRATTDAAYVWLLVEYAPDEESAPDVLVGFDVLDPERGNFRWPVESSGELPVGLEFVLEVRDGQARLQADSSYRPVRIDTLDFTPPGEPSTTPLIERPLPGFFRGRFRQSTARTLQPGRSNDGNFRPLRVLTNRSRFGRDSTEYAAMGYEWGILPPGPGPDGLWERIPGALEVRIPWQLLNVADPSQRLVLAYDRLPNEGELGTTPIEGIRLMYSFETDSGLRSWPSEGDASDVPELTWPRWETPRWETRIRPVYRMIRDAWAEVEPVGDEPAPGADAR